MHSPNRLMTKPSFFRDTEVPQRNSVTKIVPSFRVNFLVRFASKPLFYWVMPLNCSEKSLVLFVRFFGFVGPSWPLNFASSQKFTFGVVREGVIAEIFRKISATSAEFPHPFLAQSIGPATAQNLVVKFDGEICGGVLVENASDNFPQQKKLENLLSNFARSSPPISPKTSPTSLWKSLVLK